MHDSGSAPEANAKLLRPRRFFTVTEANRAVVLVRRIVEDMLLEYARMSDLHETFEAATGSGRCELARYTRWNLLQAVEHMGGFAEELEEIGVDLRDWTVGVVDFPSIAVGREIARCGKAGEGEVGAWHEGGGECTKRQTLDSLPVPRIELVLGI